MAIQLKYGCEGAKDYNEKYLLAADHARAHREGYIHIHDFDFYALTTTCCQIDLIRLFSGGFSTGHGFLREPNDIRSYAALACIAVQSNQNDQHGGQSIVNFDYGLAPGVKKTYRKNLISNTVKAFKLLAPECDISKDSVKLALEHIKQNTGTDPSIKANDEFSAAAMAWLIETTHSESTAQKIFEFVAREAYAETDPNRAAELLNIVRDARGYDGWSYKRLS